MHAGLEFQRAVVITALQTFAIPVMLEAESCPMSPKKIIAGIDAGGTTFKCAVANLNGEILECARIVTTSPEETISDCIDFFRSQEANYDCELDTLGIGSFGPLDIEPTSESFGTILDTPKEGWSRTPLKQAFEIGLGTSVKINTDVNAALLAEMRSGSAVNTSSAAYVTIGTGIGAGIYANGNFLGSPTHPEFGHIFVKRHRDDEAFRGVCSFHGECLEGLASAAAFEARYGAPSLLPTDHPGWRIEAFYLAQACIVLNTTIRPEKIILGGGLMQATNLIDHIRAQFRLLNADYLPISPEQVSELIVPPKHGLQAGLKGALELAKL